MGLSRLVLSTIISIAFPAIAALPKTAVIMPGVGFAGVEIGKPISPTVLAALGKPSELTYGRRGKADEGVGNWGRDKYGEPSLQIKFGTKTDNKAVFAIHSRVVGWRTEKGIGIGSSLSQVKSAYPSIKEVPGGEYGEDWEIPGMTLTLVDDNVFEIHITNIQK